MSNSQCYLVSSYTTSEAQVRKYRHSIQTRSNYNIMSLPKITENVDTTIEHTTPWFIPPPPKEATRNRTSESRRHASRPGVLYQTKAGEKAMSSTNKRNYLTSSFSFNKTTQGKTSPEKQTEPNVSFSAMNQTHNALESEFKSRQHSTAKKRKTITKN